MKLSKQLILPALVCAFVLSSCTNDAAQNNDQAQSNKTESTQAQSESISVENCGETVTYAKHDSIFANDGNIISFLLAVGAQDHISAVSSVQRDIDVLAAKYGDVARTLPDVAKEYPSLEQVVAQNPDIFFAGYGYGFSEEKNLTPASLQDHGIGAYQLSEACRQASGKERGTFEPWDAVRMDIQNIGTITEKTAEAEKVVADIDDRLEQLKTLEQPETAPTAFIFDSGTDSIFTSGRFGAPQAILDAAGARNAAEDVEDTWTTVGWEKLVSSKPDVFVFVDYPGQSFEEKIEVLRNHPATKDLEAVKEGRFINLPYAMWCSGPMNIDAAEHVRAGLEHFGLAPKTGFTPEFELPASTAGLDYVS